MSSDPRDEGGLAPDDAVDGAADRSDEPEVVPARTMRLGEGLRVRRTLPARRRPTIGAWCFLDEMGPVDLATEPGLAVPPHPHIGLQTVTWLTAGEVLHRDSLGSVQPIRPGQLNLMTSGRGISHSEESATGASGRLHGVQLWTVLPEASAGVEPAFDHHAELPRVELGGLAATVLVGTFAGATSPARTFSPLVGAELVATGPVATALPLDPAHEHGLVVLDGGAAVAGHALVPGALLHVPVGADELAVRAPAGARLLLLGGTPWTDPLVMWWNFVAADPEAVLAARDDWERGHPRFGTVEGFPGDRVPAPPLPAGRLKPRR